MAADWSFRYNMPAAGKVSGAVAVCVDVVGGLLYRPSNTRVHLRNGSALLIIRAATL